MENRTRFVKVAFFRGTSLRPVSSGDSKHKEVRYLDSREDDQLDEAPKPDLNKANRFNVCTVFHPWPFRCGGCSTYCATSRPCPVRTYADRPTSSS